MSMDGFRNPALPPPRRYCLVDLLKILLSTQNVGLNSCLVVALLCCLPSESAQESESEYEASRDRPPAHLLGCDKNLGGCDPR
jgi:hypothetical protein